MCSEYGVNATEDIVGGIADQYNIVSGLAVGIDTIAHETTLSTGGKTIAVLGSGIDYVFPSSNMYLYKRIKENGLVISEYPGMTPPRTDTFPMRNRIIAMFSKAILVICGKRKSGTMRKELYGPSAR